MDLILIIAVFCLVSFLLGAAISAVYHYRMMLSMEKAARKEIMDFIDSPIEDDFFDGTLKKALMKTGKPFVIRIDDEWRNVTAKDLEYIADGGEYELKFV